MSSFASADIISIIGQGLLVRMDPTKAAKAGEGRKLLQHKIGTDIGPGKAPISDFMLISAAERDLV